MKKVSLIAMLAMIYPDLVFGYNYTITDENIRNQSYSVEEINQDVYNDVRPVGLWIRWMRDAENPSVPVFQTVENNQTKYYKLIVPDLTRYKTLLNADIFSTTNQGNDAVNLWMLDNNDKIIQKSYYYNQLPVTNNAITNSGAANISSVNGDFMFLNGAIRNNGHYYEVLGGEDIASITSITGNFIKNFAGINPAQWYNNDGVTVSNGYGGAINNQANIDTISGNFIGNFANAMNNGVSGGGAIDNSGNIGSVSGMFIGNYAYNSDRANYVGYGDGYGGAIHNNGDHRHYCTINSIHGDFIGNYAGIGGAISNHVQNAYYSYNPSNNTTINEIVGDFIDNHASSYGGAIYNDGKINSVTGNFIGNYAYNQGGAINNSGVMTLTNNVIFSGNFASQGGAIYNNGQLNMNIDSDSAIRFETSDDSIYTSSGRITVTGTGTTPGHLYLQSVIGSDSDFVLYNINAETAPEQYINQRNFYIDENSILNMPDGNLYIYNNFTNDGVLRFDGGTFYARNTSGSGNIIIDGDVIATSPISQTTIINANGSLTASIDNIINSNITNNGTLWINEGVLDRNLSTFTGNIGTSGTLTANANYLDQDFMNKGNLTLSGGTLSHNITGGNGIVSINGNVVVNADVVQDLITVDSMDYSLVIDADNIKSNALHNWGTLVLGDGTLSANLLTAEYTDHYNSYSGAFEGSYLDYYGGNLVINGNVISNAKISQPITINRGKKLTISGDDLTPDNSFGYYENGQPADYYNAITNNGILEINGGTLKNKVDGGNVIVNGNWDIKDIVNVSNATINGIVNMNISNLSKDSVGYSGGKLVANSVTFGDNAELRLIVGNTNLRKNESSGDIKLVESNIWNGNWHNILHNNAQYEMTFDENMHTVRFTRVKGYTDILQTIGGSHNMYVVIMVWEQDLGDVNSFVQQIMDQLNYMAQYDNAGFLSLLSNIAPMESGFISGTSRTVNSAINDQVTDRLSLRGRNGGDVFKGVSVWGQGLYNHSSQSGSSEFVGNTFGFSLGADKKLKDNIILGLGYSLSNTSAKSGDRNIDATGHTVFAYGEYRPHTNQYDNEGNLTGVDVSQLYFNATLSYGITSYEEKAGYGISSEYNTNTWGVNADVGYDITKTMDLFTGARYLKIIQDDYTDNLGQRISVKDDDIITTRIGTRYTGNGSVFIPTAHLELSYDVKSSDRVAVVNANTSSYQISGDSINPFGIQTGIGFIGNINNWNLSLNYDIEWRPEFMSHTGRIKAKYVF